MARIYDTPIVAECAECGDGIHEGERVYTIENHLEYYCKECVHMTKAKGVEER